MIRIYVPATEQWDELNECFINTDDQVICLEHSLLSLSKWETKWNKPFISKIGKTIEETLDYIQCMTINDDVDPNVYANLTNNDMKKIEDYIDAPMTAIKFAKDRGGKTNNEPITAELIYYWMITLNIPFECDEWHLNRLINLIRVCSIKNSPPKKMGQRELASRNAQLNAQRRAQLKTKG